MKKVNLQGYGDHYIHVKVAVPRTLSKKQKALMQAYAELEDDTPGQIYGVTYDKDGKPIKSSVDMSPKEELGFKEYDGKIEKISVENQEEKEPKFVEFVTNNKNYRNIILGCVVALVYCSISLFKTEVLETRKYETQSMMDPDSRSVVYKDRIKYRDDV